MDVVGEYPLMNEPIGVTTEDVLMLLGRLYLENYTLRRQIAALTPPPVPPTEPPPTPPTEP